MAKITYSNDKLRLLSCNNGHSHQPGLTGSDVILSRHRGAVSRSIRLWHFVERPGGTTGSINLD